MNTATEPDFQTTSCGVPLDTSPESFGPLRDSTDALDDVEELRRRMQIEGYLFLPGLLDRDLALRARSNITDRLMQEGMLDPSYPAMEAVAAPELDLTFKPDLAHDNEPLHSLLYSGRMMEFYEGLLDGQVRHFDFTWMRAIAPGRYTRPHGDIVFMGRGTHDLYTAWVPLGDVPQQMGGLMVLEGSNRLDYMRNEYSKQDVDTYCENVPGEKERALNEGWLWNPSISENPKELRELFRGRWLSTEYRAGDLLTFTSYTVHASLDNHTDRVRLSSDSRYQLASAPIDERWIGEAPPGHGPDGKRGLIC